MTSQLIIVTGGPGAGKTTLVNLLHQHGFAVCAEAGRAIIQDQTAIGGTALPWGDTALFAELMLCWDIRSYRWAAQQPGPVFFDHALPGLPGYWRLLGRPVPAHFEAAAAAFRYHAQVFVAPPWPEIYRTDRERRQSIDEARHTYDLVVDTYLGYGYDLIELPRCAPAERVRFVLQHPAVAVGPPGAGSPDLSEPPVRLGPCHR